MQHSEFPGSEFHVPLADSALKEAWEARHLPREMIIMYQIRRTIFQNAKLSSLSLSKYHPRSPKNALAMKKDLRNHLLFRPMPANVLTLCTKCHASHADEKGKRFFWASLHVFWTWALLLDLTTILLEMATLLLDLRVLLDLILPSCSTWPFPKPYPGLHRNFSDSRALELHFIFPNPKTVDILPKRVRT